MIPVNKIEQYTLSSILSFSDAKELISKLKSEGKKVGLCHGGFDMLHPGHMKHFEMSGKECDVLIFLNLQDLLIS